MNAKLARSLLVAMFMALPARAVWSNLASPFPVEVKQPSGQSVTLFLRGTEKLHWYEYVPEAAKVTPELMRSASGMKLARTPGFTVMQDAMGRYVYATVNSVGEWAATDRVVGQDAPPSEQRRVMPPPAEMTRMALRRLPESGLPPRVAAPMGEVRNLVVLMRFSDHATRPLPSRQNVETLFNAAGGDPVLAPTGSVLDFYRENSYGKMTLRSTVVDWITLPKTEAYYANGQSGLDVRVREAMVDALNIISQNNLVNFKQFDMENNGAGDGWIDAITFVHSGYAAEFGGVAGGADAKDRIWSHRWVINTWTDTASGVRVRDYNINPGLWGTSGSAIGRIGVVCHELGHFFGLPDLYDYSGMGEGIGSWCLMANSWGFDGSQLHPPHMSAWCKIALGWNTAQVITAENTYKVPATTSSNAKIYRINYPAGSADEYLLIENRQPVGDFEGGIPSGTAGRGGLAIWHIDDAKTENDTPGFPGQPGWPGNGKHYWVALLQADGEYDLEKGINRGDADDVYRAGHVDALTATTVPSSNSYTGATIPAIQKISATGNEMTFQLGTGMVEPPAEPAVFAGFVQLGVPESHSVNFSPDGTACTLIFDRLTTSIFRDSRVRTTAASFVLPLKKGGAKATIHLRGFVAADDGANASLTVQINGRSQVIDLQAAREPSSGSVVLHDPTKENIQEFQDLGGTTAGFSWIKQLEVEIPVDTSLAVSTILITERPKGTSTGAFLAIDSLDVELKPAP